jgi:hypothetical protein
MTFPRDFDWGNVAAAVTVLTLFGAGALYFSAYRPKPFTEQERAAMKARSLANCGAGMYDVVPHDGTCPRFDAIRMQVDAYELTLHADGRAVLDTAWRQEEPDRFSARIGAERFRELSNMLALLRLDRRGHTLPATPGTGRVTVMAGCGGAWSSTGNVGGAPGEIEAVEACLHEFREQADWLKRAPTVVDDGDGAR